MSVNKTILEKHKAYLKAMQEYINGEEGLSNLCEKCQQLLCAIYAERQATATFTTVKQLTEEEFAQLEIELWGTSPEDILSKQEEILAKYGIVEADFVTPYATWRDLASFLNNSFESDPNEYFIMHLRTYLLRDEPEVGSRKTKNGQTPDDNDCGVPCRA
jgi:hypothetical protein